MRLSQQKYDNRSTSGSQYFQQRFCENDMRQQNKLPSRNHHQNLFSPRLLQQEIKVVNEYEVFKPSQTIGQKKQQLYEKNSTPSNLSQRQNSLFSSGQYLGFNHNSQRIHHNNVENYHSKDYHKPSHSNSRHSSRKLKIFKVSTNFDTASQNSDTNKQNSYYKENMQPNVPITKKQTTSNINDAYKMIEPVTFSKIQQSHQNPQLRKVSSQTEFSKITDHNFLQQPHILLEHIHCTISHQSRITQVFKEFVKGEKQRISQRFNQVMMEISNTVNQIKSVLVTKVDQHYQLVLDEMKSLKSMAEFMWQHKREKRQSICKGLEQSYIYSNGLPNNHLAGPESGLSSIRSSKSNYKNISQAKRYSPPSNNNLLRQLCQEDRKLQAYKQANNFYFRQIGEENSGVRKDKLLKQMYEKSLIISGMMKQCQYDFYEKVGYDQRQRQRLFFWFNRRSNDMVGEIVDFERVNSFQYGSIRQLMNGQQQKLYKQVGAFRERLLQEFTLVTAE